MAEKTSVYKGIQKAMKILAAGIAKNHKNTQQGFNFRSIDDVYKSMNPALTESGLVIIPKVHQTVISERKSNSGKPLYHVAMDIDYTIVSVDDGSSVECRISSESSDSGDKSVSKAIAMNYKYMCFTVFSPPIEGSDDGDRDSYGAEPEDKVDDKALNDIRRSVTETITRLGVAREAVKAHTDITYPGKSFYNMTYEELGSLLDWLRMNFDKEYIAQLQGVL